MTPPPPSSLPPIVPPRHGLPTAARNLPRSSSSSHPIRPHAPRRLPLVIISYLTTDINSDNAEEASPTHLVPIRPSVLWTLYPPFHLPDASVHYYPLVPTAYCLALLQRLLFTVHCLLFTVYSFFLSWNSCFAPLRPQAALCPRPDASRWVASAVRSLPPALSCQTLLATSYQLQVTATLFLFWGGRSRACMLACSPCLYLTRHQTPDIPDAGRQVAAAAAAAAPAAAHRTYPADRAR